MTTRAHSRLLTVCALAVMLGASLLSLHALARADFAGKPEAETSADAGRPSNPATLPASQEPEAPGRHLLAASYYSLKDGLSATLMFNNKSPRAMNAHVALFSLAGERRDLPPVSVDALSYRTVDLREYVAAGSPFEEGSLEVVYYGKILQMGAQVRLVDAAHSLIFDEQLTYPAQLASTRLEGVWSLPAGAAEVRLVLSNKTAEQLSLTARVDGRGPGGQESLTLLPHETRVLDLRAAVEGPLPNVGGISIRHSGQPGALMGRVLIGDAALGYSAVSELVDPGKAQSSRLHGAGLRLRDGDDTELTPVVVARNGGDASTTLTGRVVYTKSDGSTGVAPLPSVRLRAGQSKEVVLAGALGRARPGPGAAAVGLEFDYTGRPGGVIMSAHSVGRNGNQVFRVPMLDPSAQRSSTGGYPLIFDDDSSTLVYLKNTTDRQQRYFAHLKAGGAAYVIGQKTIEPGQTVTYDVRALRDNQVPDEKGNTIPPDATRGHFKWSALLDDEDEDAEQLVMIGRAEHFDTARAMSSSYACVSCCSDTTVGSYLIPLFTVDVDADQVVDFDAVEIKQDCYGDETHVIRTFGITWSSSDPEVATVDSSGTATARNGGEADIQASFSGRESYPYSCPGFTSPGDRTRCGTCTSSFNQQRPKRGMRVRPVITGITPNRGLIGSATGFTINGRGFGSNPSVLISDAGVTYSGSSGSATQLTGTINIAGDAAGGSRTVRVSNRGQVSNSFVFFVQIPTSLTVLVAAPAAPLPNGCIQTPAPADIGTQLRVRYQVNDQEGSPLTATMSGVREDLSNLLILGVRNPNFDATDVPVIPGPTESDGTFVDVPIGVCGDPQQDLPAGVRGSLGTFTQVIHVLVGTTKYRVRTNNFTVRFRDDCAEQRNGSDIDVNTCSAP